MNESDTFGNDGASAEDLPAFDVAYWSARTEFEIARRAVALLEAFRNADADGCREFVMHQVKALGVVRERTTIECALVDPLVIGGQPRAAVNVIGLLNGLLISGLVRVGAMSKIYTDGRPPELLGFRVIDHAGNPIEGPADPKGEDT